MTTEAALFRRADAADAAALAALERDTNLVALAHVFPGVSYPEDDVRRRWQRLLADPGVTVEVVDGATGLDVYLAHDHERLHHLGVRPARWGQGLARAAVERAPSVRRLRVLEANDRARAVYAHLGWTPTGQTRASEWPPYPTELEYAR